MSCGAGRQLQLQLEPSPGNFHVPRVQPFKKKKKKEKKHLGLDSGGPRWWHLEN